MGASESRSHEEAADEATAGQDYYAILEVDENANADEIRVSFFVLSTACVPAGAGDWLAASDHSPPSS